MNTNSRNGNIDYENRGRLDLTEFSKKAEPLGILGLVVTQDGEERAKHLWDEECRRNVYSASKSFTSCAVGFALQEGLLSLEEPLTEAFSKDLPKEVSENLKKAKVRDLLTMCLGQDGAHLMGGQRPNYEEEDWVKMSLSIPFVYEPGTHFVYNNVGPYLAGILVQRRSGCNLVSYLMPRLFSHLGIRRPTWEEDPLGNTFGAGGLFLTLSELHKLGLFYLQKGSWEGRQLLNREWIMESTRKQVENGKEGYGYLFWGGSENTFRADGKYSQLSIISRETNAVITVTAECRNGAALEKAIFDEIFPQLLL